jgi:hypothetical protein
MTDGGPTSSAVPGGATASQIPGPVAATFGDASGNIDQQKANLLAQIAQMGSQAVSAYQGAQQAQVARQQAAIQSALNSAAARGVPASMLGHITTTAALPFAQAPAQLTADQQARQGQLNAIGANAGTYLTEAQGAIPAIEGQVAQKLAAVKQALDLKTQQDQYQLGLARQQEADREANNQFALAKIRADAAAAAQDAAYKQQAADDAHALAQLELQKAQAGMPGSKPLTMAEMQAAGASLPSVQSQLAQQMAGSNPLPGDAPVSAMLAYQPPTIDQQAAAALGIPPDQLGGVELTPEYIRQSPAYSQALNDWSQNIGKLGADATLAGLVKKYGTAVAQTVWTDRSGAAAADRASASAGLTPTTP